MPFILSVSPDFSPDSLSGWFFFNTWLQRVLDEPFHLELYDDFETQRQDIKADKIDLIFANPYDASMLIREKGFTAVAKPANRCDEAVIVVPLDSPVRALEDLKPGARVISTHDPDVNMMSMIMLESVDLDRSNVEVSNVLSYVLVAKELLNGQGDVGFFLKDAFDDLSDLVRSNLRVLVESQIDVVHHSLMAGSKIKPLLPNLKDALLNMQQDEKGMNVLNSMNISGWESMAVEDTEFMIDLIDTLIE